MRMPSNSRFHSLRKLLPGTLTTGMSTPQASRAWIVLRASLSPSTMIAWLFPSRLSRFHNEKREFLTAPFLPCLLYTSSSIYKNAPRFSIFGVGDYSFKPYKVAISGFYKKPVFALVHSKQDKPIMLDDTCYFLGFDDFKQALIVMLILNSNIVQEFIKLSLIHI